MIENTKQTFPKFQGKIKYVYDLIEKKTNIVNRIVLMRRCDEEVIENCRLNFNATGRRLDLFLNGEKIYSFYRPKVKKVLKQFKRILEADTGIIFESLNDLAYQFDISIKEAENMVKRKANYKWVE